MLVEKIKLDLSKSVCHVCSKKLKRNFNTEIEICNNVKCQVYEVEFSIPYKIKTKLIATAKVITKG